MTVGRRAKPAIFSGLVDVSAAEATPSPAAGNVDWADSAADAGAALYLGSGEVFPPLLIPAVAVPPAIPAP